LDSEVPVFYYSQSGVICQGNNRFILDYGPLLEFVILQSSTISRSMLSKQSSDLEEKK